MPKTSFHIHGLWFHVSWESDLVRYDQHGVKWVNKDNPECDEKSMNIILDTVNSLKKKIKKLETDYEQIKQNK